MDSRPASVLCRRVATRSGNPTAAPELEELLPLEELVLEVDEPPDVVELDEFELVVLELDELLLDELVLPEAAPELDVELEPEIPELDVLELDVDELALVELELVSVEPELDELDVLALVELELEPVEPEELELDPDEPGDSGSAPAKSNAAIVRVSALPMMPEYIWLSSP